MTPATLKSHFEAATEATLAIARRYVLESLPDTVVFEVKLNASCDLPPLRCDQRTYPDDKSPETTQRFSRCSAAELLETLWRDGRVPEWVDLSVIDEDGEVTLIEVLVCGRFTSRDDALYHQQEGWPPFHALSPALPPRHEKPAKFSLHWQKRR